MTLSNLSTEEKQKLDRALRRAEEFERGEELELMRQPLEGQLLKFTNAFQGWQNRWFVLDTKTGELRYYLKEEQREVGKSRGAMRLAGAVVSPSEEDSLAFLISPVSGDPFKLKASDTRQRSEWINRLRVAAEDQKEKKIRKALKPMKTPTVAEPVRRGTAREATMFFQLHRVATAATEQQQAMCRAMEALPSEEALNKDILLLKATSQAVLSGINDCQHMLMELSQLNIPPRSVGGRLSRQPSQTTGSPTSPNPNPSAQPKTSTSNQPKTDELPQISPLDQLDYDQEEKDEFDEKDEELGSVEENKTLILTLLSRLKLGTDLTQVSFPPFILSSRSLLETTSDFFANAGLFVQIPDQPTPELRMIQLVKWYLTSFYCGLRNGQVRKPYNPVIGEVFRCTWLLPQKSSSGSSPRIHVFAEQVSHHPPITAVYAHCPEKEIFFNCSLWPRSKFMGMHISAAISGEGCLVIGAQKGRRAEQYHFSFPTLYTRSILTTPWLELGGKIHLTCPQRGITSAITFHTKPFYGGKLHRVSAEIRNCTGTPFCRIQGEWNRGLELTHADGRIETVEVGGAGWAAERRIRPASLQHPREARRVWSSLSEKLRARDMEGAGKEKDRVEEEQRAQGASGTYKSAHFQRNGEEGWLWAHGFPGLFDE